MFTKTKIRHWVMALLVVGIFSLIPTPVFAAVNPTSTLPAGSIAYIIADIFSMLISLLNLVMWIIFGFLNYVLDPAFIFDLDADGGGSFMAMLNTIWQLSRDLMNVVFALVLVGSAIYTVVTADKEFVSSHLKNFILAVVLVNFSWFFPRVIIDIANVATSTIYGVPSLLFENSGANQCSYLVSSNEDANRCTLVEPPDQANNIPGIYRCGCQMVRDFRIFMDDQTVQNLEGQGWKCQAGIICLQMGAWNPQATAAHSTILNGLVVNFAHLGTIAKVPPPIQNNQIGKMLIFVMAEALILLIHVALFFPLLAMFIAFLIRIPILWLTIAFMPFIFLSWAIPNNPLAEETKKIWEHFLKAAFLPAIVAIPLSVGFILINAGSQLTGVNKGMGAVQIRLLDNISNLYQLFWLMMTLGVMWVGVFEMLEKHGGIMAKGSGAIRSFGANLGKIAVKAPLANIPIPGPGGQKMNIFNAAKMPAMINEGLSSGKNMSDIWKDIGSGNAARELHNKETAEKMSNNDVKLGQLHGDLKHLADIMSNRNSTDAQKNDALERIKRNNDGLNVSAGSTHADLEKILKTLQNKGVEQNFANRYRDIDREIERIKQAQNSSRSNP